MIMSVDRGSISTYSDMMLTSLRFYADTFSPSMILRQVSKSAPLPAVTVRAVNHRPNRQGEPVW